MFRWKKCLLVFAELVSYNDARSVRNDYIHEVLSGGKRCDGCAVDSLPHEEVSSDGPLEVSANRRLDIRL